YVGNYTSFVEQKKADIERQNRAYARQQKDIERLEELIEKFRYKKNKAAFAQSKIKYLDRMEKVEKATNPDEKTFHARFTPKTKGGKHVLTIDHLVVGYDRPLCEVTTEILSGQKVAIMGANGTGKSTLIKTLMGLVEPLSGAYLYGHQIETGYFDQQLAQFNSGKTVIEELWDEYPDLDRTAIRTVLGQFLFSADDVFKSVDVLSGGEKVRLSFAKLLLQHSNFLMLDEPTNHLDIPCKEALEESLKDFEGTLLFVSHDRYFVKQLATSLIFIDEDKVTYYPYGYEAYMQERKGEPVALVPKKEKKEEQPKPVRPINVKKELAKVEKQIDEKEALLEDWRQLRFEPEYYHDYRKMNELDEAIDDLHNEIENLMTRWEELSEME
ncbi:MAG: ABC-F family ATP-binding cassette domain-containing protein, partial [Erysipelotrichaceae bacterium]|nr:ABC-F family ATP-binding cassette domain-containing protein [Erysipelotrichaceae bacterium]